VLLLLVLQAICVLVGGISSALRLGVADLGDGTRTVMNLEASPNMLVKMTIWPVKNVTDEILTGVMTSTSPLASLGVPLIVVIARHSDFSTANAVKVINFRRRLCFVTQPEHHLSHADD
jgi:hypothetical protein